MDEQNTIAMAEEDSWLRAAGACMWKIRSTVVKDDALTEEVAESVKLLAETANLIAEARRKVLYPTFR